MTKVAVGCPGDLDVSSADWDGQALVGHPRLGLDIPRVRFSKESIQHVPSRNSMCFQHTPNYDLVRIFELLLFPPWGGGDHRGGVGVTGGRDSPWNKRVGFETPVSGGNAPLLLPHTRFAQSGRGPCLLPVVVPPSVGARHV